MDKCTGRRCTMQVGYKIYECNHTDCPYRTEPVTNADKIRAMSDEELNEMLHEIYNAGAEDAVAYGWGQLKDSFEWTMEWLKQSAEEGER